MIQKIQSPKKKKMKFEKKEVKKAFMNSKLTELYNRLDIVSLTIVPSEAKDSYNLMYVYEENK